MTITKNSSGILIFDSYNKYLLPLGSLFVLLAIIFGYLTFTIPTNLLPFAVISICFLFFGVSFLISKRRITTFDKTSGTIIIAIKSILGTSQVTLPISEVTNVQLRSRRVSGVLASALQYQLSLVSKNNSIAILDASNTDNNLKETLLIQPAQSIAEFLSVPFQDIPW